MSDRRLLGIGVGGAALAALCCFTPLAVVFLGGLGLSAWLGWVDLVMAPVLALSLALVLYAALRLRARRCRS